MASGYFKCIREKSINKIESILNLLGQECLTCREVALKLDSPESSLKQYFSKLYMEEKIHIKGWKKQDIYLVPVYSEGFGIDAPKNISSVKCTPIHKERLPDKIKEILKSGPLAVADIASTLNTDIGAIRYHIKKMKGDNQVHIGEWKKGSRKIIALYKLGEGADCDLIKFTKVDLTPEDKLCLSVKQKLENGHIPGSKELLASFFWNQHPDAARIIKNKQRPSKSRLH